MLWNLWKWSNEYICKRFSFSIQCIIRPTLFRPCACMHARAGTHTRTCARAHTYICMCVCVHAHMQVIYKWFNFHQATHNNSMQAKLNKFNLIQPEPGPSLTCSDQVSHCLVAPFQTGWNKEQQNLRRNTEKGGSPQTKVTANWTPCSNFTVDSNLFLNVQSSAWVYIQS